MIIKELNLIGFGKFKNQVIELKDGINIIYGENESGKSTLHNFIDGMFYGFLRPNVKSTLYTEEHKKYEPWYSDRYTGIIKFQSNGEDYRIERNFTRNREETRVFLENTGEDITYKINNGSNGRVLQPGIHFMGCSSSVFSNTVSIKQLGSRTDDKLANEVRDKLVNITSSLDDKVSVENAIKDLEKSIKEIGSERATTSSYGQLCMQLNNLLIEKDNIVKCKIEYEKLLDDNNELEKKLEILEKELETNKKNLNVALLKVKKRIYDEALNIKSNLTELEVNIKKYDKYKGLSNDDFSLATKIANEIQIISNRISDIKSQAKELNRAISEENLNFRNNDDKKINEISRDCLEFDVLEEKKNKLIYANTNIKKEFIKRDYNSIKRKSTSYRISLVIIATLYILLMGLSFARVITNFSVFFQILLIPILILLISSNRLNKSLKEKGLELKEIEKEEAERNQALEDIESNQQLILKKYNFATKTQLTNLYNSVQQSQYLKDERLKNIVDNRNKLNSLNSKVGELNLELQELETKLNSILAKNLVSSLQEFEDNLVKKKIYDDTLVEYYNKRELLNKTLDEYTLNQLETELAQYSLDMSLIDIEDKEILLNRINKIADEISNLRVEKKGIEERLNMIGPEVSKLVDIEEDIQRSKDEIQKFDNQKRALELAKSTIEELSKDIQDQFAPEINLKVGNLINRITDGKYSGVRINDKLEIGVIAPDTGELINVNSLSGGTIDQIYFSLRFGIINSINEDKVPLILDDCFIQYDDIRLANILSLLNEMSQVRQVILFSCQNREKDILSSLGIKYNLVTLS